MLPNIVWESFRQQSFRKMFWSIRNACLFTCLAVWLCVHVHVCPHRKIQIMWIVKWILTVISDECCFIHEKQDPFFTCFVDPVSSFCTVLVVSSQIGCLFFFFLYYLSALRIFFSPAPRLLSFFHLSFLIIARLSQLLSYHHMSREFRTELVVCASAKPMLTVLLPFFSFLLRFLFSSWSILFAGSSKMIVKCKM